MTSAYCQNQAFDVMELIDGRIPWALEVMDGHSPRLAAQWIPCPACRVEAATACDRSRFGDRSREFPEFHVLRVRLANALRALSPDLRCRCFDCWATYSELIRCNIDPAYCAEDE